MFCSITELTDFRAENALITNLAKHMRSREQGNVSKREQGISPKGNSAQQLDIVMSRWSSLIMGCVCFCN